MKKSLFTLKISAVLISIFFLVNSAFAQQKIKDGTVSGTELPNNDAILDLESNNKGLLLPRVALTSTTVAIPLSAHIEGMTVYNTATTGDVTPGYYYNDGTKWVKLASSLVQNADWHITGNDSTNAGTNGIGSAVDGNYLGTTNAQNLVLGTGATKRMIIDLAGNAYGGTNGSYVTPATANGGNNRNFIWGRADSLVDAGNLGNSNANAIFGANNKVISGGTLYGSTNIISGSLNIATASSSAIFGSSNKDSALYSLVAGRNNTIGSAGSHSVIIGGGDLATDGNYLAGRSSAVFGSGNKDSAGYTLVSGQSNAIGLNSTNGVAMGQGNTVAHSNSFALGTGAITTASNQLSANFSGGYHLIGIGTGAATDSIVTDSLGYLRHRSISSLANNAWSILGNAGTSSGSNSVGSAVDGNYLGTTNAQNIAIATNGVKRMIIDTLGNAVGGMESQINVDNSLGYTNGNFIWGSKDTINNDGGSMNGYNNVVFGFMNKSTAANSSIFGINNKDLNYTLDEGYNFMAGNDNTISDAMGTGASSNTVLGSGNIINASSGNAVLGNANTINNTHFNSVVVGLDNTMSADTAYTLGFNNTITHGRSLAIGNGASTTARNQFSANFSGGYRLLGIGNADATDYVVTDSAGYIRHRNIADFATSNIYTADGTLTGNRRLTMAQHTLQFYNAGATGGTTTFTDTLGADLTLAATSATGRSSIQLTAGPSGMYMFVDGNNAAQLTTSATSLNIGAFSKAPITFFTDNVERVNIDTVGRVGIGTSYPSSTLQVNGSVANAIRIITASTTLSDTDYTVIKTGASAITITLPAANTCAGRIYRIVEYAGDGNSSTITLSPGIQTYDQFTGMHTESGFWILHTNLTAAGTGGDAHSLLIQSDGTDWYSIGR